MTRYSQEMNPSRVTIAATLKCHGIVLQRPSVQKRRPGELTSAAPLLLHLASPLASPLLVISLSAVWLELELFVLLVGVLDPMALCLWEGFTECWAEGRRRVVGQKKG